MKLPATPGWFRKFIATILLLASIYSQLNAQSINPVLSTRRQLPVNWLGWDLATTTHGGVALSNPNLMEKLPSVLGPKVLRFPGGCFANFYDWKVGWYNDTSLTPSKYLLLDELDNSLESYKELLDITGADALFDLNMLTASLKDQIAMLKHADSIGIPLKYVELGNEYYLDGGTDAEDTSVIVMIYPTVEDYGEVAKMWIDTIHAYFPHVKVAVQGCFDKNNAPRRVTWNDGIRATVDNDDAWTFHFYYNSNFPDPEETEAEKLDVNMEEVPIMFYQPFAAWKIMAEVSLPKVPPGREIWVTEFNMQDFVRPTHGMWFQGMFNVLQTLLLLNDDRIKIAAPHGVAGTAVYGALFWSDHGFIFDGDFTPPPYAPSTEFWGKSASGYTLSMMSETLDKMKFASPLSFNGTLQLSAYDRNKDETHYYDALYGWHFNDYNESRAVIVNVSGSNQKITTTDLFPSGGTYQIMQAPLLNLIATAADISIVNGTLPSKLTIPPYSIVKITSSSIPAAPPPPAVIIANGSMTICSGDSVELDAGWGYDHYIWSTGETTRKIWVSSEQDYSVKAYPEPFGYCAADTVHITVNANPDNPNIVPSGNKKFCDGGSIELELDSDYDATGLSFYWPLTGENSSSITTGIEGGHYVLVTDANGCVASSDTEVVTVHPLPEPAIYAVGSKKACYDVDVTLEATAGYGQYNWSNGTSGQSKVFTASGSYYCTVKDENNCWGSSNSIYVTIWEPPLPTITASGPTNFCIEDDVHLTTLPGYEYQWQKGGNVLTGETNQTYYPTSSSGSVKVEITDEHGCKKKSDNFSVTVNTLNPPGISVAGGTAICSGETTNLSVPNTYSSYLWSNGATSNQITVSAAGNYTCTVTDQNGCSAKTNAKQITVYPLPTPVITSLGFSSACYDLGVTLIAPLGYNSYKWSDGTSGQTKIFTTSGTYYCTVTDANTCKGNSNSIAVTVWDLPVPVVNPVGSTAYCEGVTSNWLTTLPGFSYQWLKGIDNVNGATNQNFTPVSTGTYKVQISDSHGCKKKSNTGVKVTVNKTPDVSITINGSTNICNGETRKLTCSASGGTGMTFVWKKGGVAISGATDKVYTVSASGTYKCEATNSSDCNEISNAITITTNCKEDNVGPDDNNLLQVYPNPAYDNLHVNLHIADEESGNCIAEIRNMLGELIRRDERPFAEHQISFDFALDGSLPSGIYFILVRNREQMYRAQFVIAKP